MDEVALLLPESAHFLLSLAHLSIEDPDFEFANPQWRLGLGKTLGFNELDLSGVGGVGVEGSDGSGLSGDFTDTPLNGEGILNQRMGGSLFFLEHALSLVKD